MRTVAIIIERTEISLGGAERSISELAESLRKLGLGVTLLAARGQAGEGTIPLCGEKADGRVSFAAFEKALMRHLAENDYDIVHSTLPFSFCDIYQPRGGSYLEAMLRNAASYPHPRMRAWKRWTGWLNRRRTSLVRAERLLCRRCEGTTVAALSEYVREQFVRHYAMPDERIAVIPNAITLHPPVDSARIAEFRAMVRSQLGMSEGEEPAIFLFAANNFRLKGLGPLLEAMKRASSWPSARQIVVVVAGSGRPGPYLQRARRLGIAQRVLFLGAVADMQAEIAGCDTAVLPTYYDPSSRFILEALSQGRPVITTRFNGASERIEHQRHGVVLKDPGDVETLTTALVRLSHPDLVRRMSAAIVEDGLREAVSIDHHAEQLAALYETIYHGMQSNG